MDVEKPEALNNFAAFRSIDDYDYLDLYLSYNLWDERIKVSFGVTNLTDEDPPVLGNEIGDTSSNSGNTFPSNFDTLGRFYTFGLRFSL